MCYLRSDGVGEITLDLADYEIYNKKHSAALEQQNTKD